MKEEQQNNSIFSGLFWKFGERIFSQGASFVVSVVLARLLMPADYGIISLVMVFISLAEVFVVSGFSTALIQKKDADATDFSTMFYCSFAVSVLIYGVIFAAAPLIADFYAEPLLVDVLRVLSLRIPLSAYNSIQNAYVSRHMMFKRFFYSTLLGTVISGIVGIVMAFLGFGVWALVAQYLTNTVINTLVLRFTVPWHLELKFSAAAVKPLMSYGWKVLAADLIGNFSEKLRALIIGRVYSTEDLAYFDKGQQLPDLVTTNISSSVMSVLFPAMANTSDDSAAVKQLMKRSLGVLAYVIFPMMAGLMAVASPLVNVLYTEKWAECVPFLQLMCLSSAISLLSTTSLQSIKAIGRSDVLLRIELIKKPVYLLMLLISIQINVLAVAVSMVTYSVYSTLVNSYQLKKLLDYSLMEQLRDIAMPFTLALVMGILVSLVRLLQIPAIALLVLQVLLGVGLYVGMSVIFKVNEFMYLKDVLLSFLRKNKGEADGKDAVT